jgi:hypothetical protein
MGRNSQNKVLVFADAQSKPGAYRNVEVTGATPATLIGRVADGEEGRGLMEERGSDGTQER